MGNTSSELTQSVPDDIWWNPIQAKHTMDSTTQTQSSSQSLNELKLELDRKHERRRQIIAEKQKEMLDLRQEVEKYKKDNEDLKNLLQGQTQFHETHLKQENEDLKLEVEHLKLQLTNTADVAARNKELRISVTNMQAELQNVNSELVAIEQERLEYGKHISALKDVVRVTKDMLLIRENQIQDLKNKVNGVEELLASKEMKIMSDELREEYEKQLKNIRNLRVLYEERQRLDKRDKQQLQDQLDETKKLFEDEQKKSSELQERITELENDNSKKYDTILNLQSNLGLSKAECKELQAEIDVINQLFSQILLGFNSSQEIDLDKLIKILEENHDLLTNIVTNEVSNSTAAALPKLLLDLINQMDKNTADTEASGSEAILSSDKNQVNSAEEIVENLPKVWKILIELLSQHTPPSNILHGNADLCYKSVETPSGPKLKLSVSQTFIRLKDLILEKKFLERETYRLKHLNTHLESRLGDQEKRLELVSSELTNTWHVVGKMQRQHQQLHTHEKVLRYELQQKRKLLNELKEELQYARDKWVMAREKNDTTQEQWKELRKEFAARKVNDDFNQSAESGYSDDKDTSEDERGYESDVSDVKREHDLELEPNHEVSCTNEVIHSDENSETELVQNSSERQSLEVQSNNSKSVTETEDIVNNSDCSINNESNKGEILSTKPETDILSKPRSTEEIFAARDERLKRLEEQSKCLLAKVTNTTQKSVNLSNKLDNLHEIYGESSTHERLSPQSQSTNETQLLLKHETLSTDSLHVSPTHLPSTSKMPTLQTLTINETLLMQVKDDIHLTQSQGINDTTPQIPPTFETMPMQLPLQSKTMSIQSISTSKTGLTDSSPCEIVSTQSPSQPDTSELVCTTQILTLPAEDAELSSASETMSTQSPFISNTSTITQQSKTHSHETASSSLSDMKSIKASSTSESSLTLCPYVDKIVRTKTESTSGAQPLLTSETVLIQSISSEVLASTKLMPTSEILSTNSDYVEIVPGKEVSPSKTVSSETQLKDILLTSTSPISETIPRQSTNDTLSANKSTSSETTNKTVTQSTDEIVSIQSSYSTECETTLTDSAGEIVPTTLPSSTEIMSIESPSTVEIVSTESADEIVSTQSPSSTETISIQFPTTTGTETESIQLVSTQVQTESTQIVSVESSSASQLVQSTEDRLQKRDERLKRLEEQCKQLVTKVTNTSQKSRTISNKLDNLHEIYGESSTSESATDETSSSKESGASKEGEQ